MKFMRSLRDHNEHGSKVLALIWDPAATMKLKSVVSSLPLLIFLLISSYNLDVEILQQMLLEA